MSKKVLLVGHCGPDSAHLRSTVRKAVPEVELVSVDDSQGLTQALTAGVDLVLFNRELGFGYDPDTGVEAIRALRPAFPQLKMILVSNFEDAQQAAEAAGAQPGFGKRELGSPRVLDLLREMLGAVVAK